MKRIILILLILASNLVQGQEIEKSPLDFYSQTLTKEQRFSPLPYVRESDVIWEYKIWRTIDLREKCNQYIYYPIEAKGVDGRKNLAWVLWNALINNEIEVFEDDELKIPKDSYEIIKRYTKADTMILEIEDDDENYEYKTVIIPRDFTTEEILHFKLKETWYLDKQSTDQWVRITALAPIQEQFKERNGEREYRGSIALFWIPMNSFNVRMIMARNEAYYEDNIAHLPTWEYIFRARRFSSFITRESNKFNRTIDSYLTGEDAIRESEKIEDMLLNISQDQWEY